MQLLSMPSLVLSLATSLKLITVFHLPIMILIRVLYWGAAFVISFAIFLFIMVPASMQLALVCVLFSLFYVFYDTNTNASIMSIINKARILHFCIGKFVPAGFCLECCN